MSTQGQNHKTWVEVSRKALLNNAEIVRGLLSPNTRLVAVVKSNAYGHGLVETAKIFQMQWPSLQSLQRRPLYDSGGLWFGVDNLDEAIQLRKSGIIAPILVLGYTPANQIQMCEVYDQSTYAVSARPSTQKFECSGLRFTIYDPEVLNQIVRSYKPSAISHKLHLKVDTGMSRQGVTLIDLPKFLKNWPRSLAPEGVYTHFANADNLIDRRYPNLQFANFHKALKILCDCGVKPEIIHASATTGLLTMPEAHFDMVRVGVALYGLWPSREFEKKFRHFGLEPALSWKTKIVQVKQIKKGTPVGYGITEKVKKDTQIAVLPIGYYDGYMRALSGRGEVLVNGKRCRILGRISMNLSVVDASSCRDVKVGDEVVLIGVQGRERITAEELAGKAGTISYEIVSRINPLLVRVYIDD